MTVGRWAARGCAALALLASCSAQTAAAYTIKQTENGATVRWHSPTVVLRVDESIDQFFGDMNARAIIADAAAAWGGLEGVPVLLISEGSPGERGFHSDRNGHRGSNGVYLVEDWDMAESSLAVTVATYESRTGRIVDTDILVNANHPFDDVPTGPEHHNRAYDLRGVMTHEMGHVLGLGESYEERMATMWPNIARGETHQRNLHEDDENGALEAYAGAPLAETYADGCGRASVIVPRAPQSLPWLSLLGALALALAAWRWLKRTADGPRHLRTAGTCAFALLFAGPFDIGRSSDENERVEIVRTLATRRLPPAERQKLLQRAAESRSAQVRMAAAAVLERAGSREDRALAAKLSRDRDPEVRRLGRNALARLQSAPPLARVKRSDPDAQRRLGRMLKNAKKVVRGEVINVGTRMRKGVIWSRYLLHAEDGATEVEIPGGSLGEYTQVVSEQEPPADGDTLLVALQGHGAHGWAHFRDGVVYGGWLGEGPAIEWDEP
jgi:hypothetical protein